MRLAGSSCYPSGSRLLRQVCPSRKQWGPAPTPQTVGHAVCDDYNKHCCTREKNSCQIFSLPTQQLFPRSGCISSSSCWGCHNTHAVSEWWLRAFAQHAVFAKNLFPLEAHKWARIMSHPQCTKAQRKSNSTVLFQEPLLQARLKLATLITLGCYHIFSHTTCPRTRFYCLCSHWAAAVRELSLLIVLLSVDSMQIFHFCPADV